MIPIRDTIQSKNYPVINTAIIGINVLVYLVELTQGQGLDRFILLYGLVPARYSIPEIREYFSLGQQLFSFLSFMFLHGGFWHLLGNMWSLYIFGDNVEDRIGPLRYLIFYLVCGWASGASHLLLNWHSQIPTIGASGAIAGVMGAYFILYPGSRILTLIPIFFIPYFIEIPAFIFLGIWFLLQFLSAAGSYGQISGVAWWAHIGGFVFGIVSLKLFEKLPRIGFTRTVRHATSKKRTYRLQTLRLAASPDSSHLYGRLAVTPREARVGTSKMINIPLGIQHKLIRVTVPAGVHDGTVLRLPGMGRRRDGEKRGDLYLRVVIQDLA
jgi:membrane associated rhomboid family serine protease